LTALSLITEPYRELNKKLHERDPMYGASSGKWAIVASKMAEKNQFASILDYGAGKGDLERGLRQHWAGAPVCEVISYDPAVPGMEFKKPCDLVVCTDVLEHVEPECVDAVLDDIRDLTKQLAFITVSTMPAEKTLEDGRNAHVSLHDARWWSDKIWDRFEVIRMERVGQDIRFVCAREVQLVRKAKAPRNSVVLSETGVAFA
jgi:hypothetical protein